MINAMWNQLRDRYFYSFGKKRIDKFLKKNWKVFKIVGLILMSQIIKMKKNQKVNLKSQIMIGIMFNT